MKPRVSFALRAVAISIALFAAWSPVSRLYVALLTSLATGIRALFGAGPAVINTEANSHFYVPVIAIVLAAAGLTARRKLRYCGLALGCLFAFDFVNVSTGLIGLSGESWLPAIIYRSFVWGLPVFVLLLSTQGSPPMLWEAPERPAAAGLQRCPICGQAKTGLRDHIKAAHGEKTLRSWRVRRHLAGT